MAARPSTLYLTLTGALLAILAGLAAHARYAGALAEPAILRTEHLVRNLDLTDLCLFTEASYTRHPAMTDLATPFLDSPGALEHFPSGALVGPPAHIARNHAQRY